MSGVGSKSKWASFVCILSLVLWAVSCGIAFAAGGHEGSDRSGDLLDLLYRFINFALLVIILFWVGKKAGLKGFFTARSEEISWKLDELRRGKEEAEAKFQEMEKQLREFEGSKHLIIEQLKAEGLAEKERIISEAQERAKQIFEQAELTVRREMEYARDRLKREMVNLSAQKAQEILAREMTDNDQDRLVDEFIERLGEIH